jgi:two-component system, cell cycle sensor histidine kinase DivJ
LFEELTRSTRIVLQAAPLPAAVRLDIHRKGRLTAAAFSLCLASPLCLAAGSPAVAAALLLAGLLPAAVALECRSAQNLGRAVAATLLISGAVLSAGILRGLPVEAALVLLATIAAEAVSAAGRGQRRLAFAVGAVAAAMIAAAGMATVTAPSWPAAAAALVLAASAAGGLALRIAASSRVRVAAHRRRLRQLRRGTLLQAETLLSVDRKGCVVEVGGNVSASLGLPRNALLGRGLADLTLVADRPLLMRALGGGTADAAAPPIRFRLRAGGEAAEPRYRWVELRLPGTASEGVALAGLRDVSDVVASEVRLAEAAATAARGEAASTAFLSTLNHEIRTPLNAIIGFSELLANPSTSPSDPARARAYAGMIHQAGRDLMRKASTMIDIVRLQSGAYAFTPERADAGELVRAVVDGYAQEHGLSGTAIAFSRPVQPVVAEFDGRVIRTALTELLANASRHGGGRGVAVSVAAAEGGIALTVSDQGPGVPAEALPSLQRALAGTHADSAGAGGGMGLGLTLARGLAALHGGLVSIANGKDGGAVTTLLLPAARDDAGSATIVNIADVRKSGHATAPAERKRRRA